MHALTRTRAAFVAIALAAPAAVAGTVLGPPLAAVAATTGAECPLLDEPVAHPDLDGDDRPDAGVGVPDATVAGVRAGAVDVHFGSGRVQRVSPASVSGIPGGSGAQFGAALVELPWEINDRCDDLAVGAPGVAGGRGAVALLHAGPSGVQAGGARALVGRSSGERFGTSIAVGQRGDRGTDLFVGAPNRTVSGRAAAGAIDHYVIPDDGSAPRYVGSLTQDTAGVPGTAEAGDHFGAVLAMRGDALAVGVPDEAIGSHRQAGAVAVLKVAPNAAGVLGAASLAQHSGGTPGLAEAGDRFGAALTWAFHPKDPGDPGPWPGGETLVVGSPGEAVGSRAAAGIVYFYNDFSVADPYSGVRFVTQDSAGVPGVTEAGDRFGASLAALSWCPGAAVAVGVPGEDLGGAADAGQLNVVQTRRPGTDACERQLFQGSGGGLGGAAESGDQVGAAVAELVRYTTEGQAPDQLLVGVPGEDVGSVRDAGGVSVVTPTTTGYGVRSFGDSAGRVAGMRYGRFLL
ncbi:MAG: hypothetical protein ACTHLJ_13995 [Angustibacter sp.]